MGRDGISLDGDIGRRHRALGSQSKTAWTRRYACCSAQRALRVPVYGSGGFTSYSIDELREQLGRWADAGIAWVKMKVGRDPSADVERVRAAREAIGSCGLFVDANGAYSRKQALQLADTFAQSGV